MKGVSPVVATVLLIAIAVIAAVGVWFFVQNMTSKQSSAPTMTAFQVESCSVATGNLSLINLGDAAFASKVFQIYYGVNGTALPFATSITLPAGSGSRAVVSSNNTIISGAYYALASGVPKISFNCA